MPTDQEILNILTDGRFILNQIKEVKDWDVCIGAFALDDILEQIEMLGECLEGGMVNG